MFFVNALFALLRALIGLFWGPWTRSHDRERTDERDDAGDVRSHHHRLDMLEVTADRNDGDLEIVARGVQSRDAVLPIKEAPVESGVVTDSFLAQLEQRTQQVKITLANLEAEKTRIESQIAQLEPIVPHYEALLQAERAIAGSNIAFDSVGDAGGAESAAAPDAPESAPEAMDRTGGNSPTGEPTAQGSNWTSYDA